MDRTDDNRPDYIPSYYLGVSQNQRDDPAGFARRLLIGPVLLLVVAILALAFGALAEGLIALAGALAWGAQAAVYAPRARAAARRRDGTDR